MAEGDHLPSKASVALKRKWANEEVDEPQRASMHLGTTRALVVALAWFCSVQNQSAAAQAVVLRVLDVLVASFAPSESECAGFS
eukprot:9488000-Alexandrium_andersonii.AAC.1